MRVERLLRGQLCGLSVEGSCSIAAPVRAAARCVRRCVQRVRLNVLLMMRWWRQHTIVKARCCHNTDITHTHQVLRHGLQQCRIGFKQHQVQVAQCHLHAELPQQCCTCHVCVTQDLQPRVQKQHLNSHLMHSASLSQKAAELGNCLSTWHSKHKCACTDVTHNTCMLYFS